MKKKQVFSQRSYDTGMKLMDLGNWAAGALVFGQGISGLHFDLRVAAAGFVAVVFLYIIGWAMMRGGGK